MSEIVEKVARAIWAAKWSDPHCAASPAFEDAIQDARFALEEQARAAIAAMREPTQDMCVVGSGWTCDKYENPDQEGAAEAWRAMIDEALK